MALTALYWPDIPNISTTDFSDTIPSNIHTSSMDTGANHNRTRDNSVIRRVTATYSLTSAELQTLRDFVDLAMSRSYWMCFPNPLDKFALDDDGNNVYRYARLHPDDDTTIATPEYDGKDKWLVTLSFDFWIHVPAGDIYVARR